MSLRLITAALCRNAEWQANLYRRNPNLEFLRRKDNAEGILSLSKEPVETEC